MACAMPIPVPSGRSCRDPLSSSAALGRAGLQTMELEEAPDGNPNGTRSASSADHHRVGRYLDRRGLQGARGAGGRAGVRRFLARFRGKELEVALEATTGWRFVVEELRRIGAIVHLAEPAETAACEATRSAPRTTVPTPGICGSC